MLFSRTQELLKDVVRELKDLNAQWHVLHSNQYADAVRMQTKQTSTELGHALDTLETTGSSKLMLECDQAWRHCCLALGTVLKTLQKAEGAPAHNSPTEKASSAVRIRGAYAEFRSTIRRIGRSFSDPEVHLGQLHREINRLLLSYAFAEARLQDRVLMSSLLGRIEAAFADVPITQDTAQQLCSDVHTAAETLLKISSRQELRAHDSQLLKICEKQLGSDDPVRLEAARTTLGDELVGLDDKLDTAHALWISGSALAPPESLLTNIVQVRDALAVSTTSHSSTAIEGVPLPILAQVQDALLDGSGGEIVVRDGARCGRIYVHEGAIAWVTCDRVTKVLRQVLEEEAQIPPDELTAVLDECKKTGTHFAEMLVKWGLISTGKLRGCLLQHIAYHFEVLCNAGTDVQALFMPQARKYSGELLFSLDELVLARAGSIQQALEPTAAAEPEPLKTDIELKSLGLAIPGCVHLVVVQLDTHTLVEQWSKDVPFYTDTAEWNALADDLLYKQNIPHIFGDPKAEKAPITSSVVLLNGPDLCIVQRSDAYPNLAMVVVCASTRNIGLSIGMTRNAMKSLEVQLSES